MEVSNIRVESSNNMVTNSKLSVPESGSDSASTMDSFQDGGQQNMLDRSSGEFSTSQNMDSSRVNSDINTYNPGGGEPGIVPSQGYSKIPSDHMPGGQMSGFNNTGFSRSTFAVNDQHGGMPGAGSGDFSQQNSQVMQYGPQNMRPGYPPSSRPPAVASRPGMSGGPMSVMPQNYGPGQPRFPLSGPNIQQQGGPTPTLNQLLQNNQNQRYPGGYGDYNLGHPKPTAGQELGGNEGFNPSQTWGGQQRPGMGPYPPQSTPPFRNQAQMYNDRRPVGMNYPQGQGGQQFGAQSQFSPNSQRISSQHMPGRPGQGMPGPYSGTPNNQMGTYNSQPSNHSYLQQTGQQSSQHQSHHLQNFLQQSVQHQQQPPGTSQSQLSPGQHSQSTPPQPSPGQSLSSPQQRPDATGASEHRKEQTSQLGAMLSSPEAQNASDSQHSISQDSNCSQQSLEESTGGKGNSSGSESRNSTDTPTSRSTPTPSSTPGPQHPGLSSLRPTPSPVGSTGSRSNTPHSVTGNQLGPSSPMPPRPPSSQHDGQSRIHSPMATQGYNHQMMPPPMGPSGQMSYNSSGNTSGGKLHSAVMAGNMQMPPYNNQYPNQQPGGYGRPGIPGYGQPPGQQTPYNQPGQVGPGNQMYNNMVSAGPINRQVVNAGYPSPTQNQYPSSQSGTSMNQYGNYPGSGPSLSPQVAANQGVSIANQVPVSCPKGAQAAAQAAMAAAANQTGTTKSYGSRPTTVPQTVTPPPSATSPHHGQPQRPAMYPGHYPLQQQHNQYNSINQMQHSSGIGPVLQQQPGMDGHGLSGSGPASSGPLPPVYTNTTASGPLGNHPHMGMVSSAQLMSVSNEIATAQTTSIGNHSSYGRDGSSNSSEGSTPINSITGIPANSSAADSSKSTVSMNSAIATTSKSSDTVASVLSSDGNGETGSNFGQSSVLSSFEQHPSSKSQQSSMPISSQLPDNSMAGSPDKDSKPAISHAGDTSTTVTQSVTGPVSTAAENKSAVGSVASSTSITTTAAQVLPVSHPQQVMPPQLHTSMLHSQQPGMPQDPQQPGMLVGQQQVGMPHGQPQPDIHQGQQLDMPQGQQQMCVPHGQQQTNTTPQQHRGMSQGQPQHPGMLPGQRQQSGLLQGQQQQEPGISQVQQQQQPGMTQNQLQQPDISSGQQQLGMLQSHQQSGMSHGQQPPPVMCEGQQQPGMTPDEHQELSLNQQQNYQQQQPQIGSSYSQTPPQSVGFNQHPPNQQQHLGLPQSQQQSSNQHGMLGSQQQGMPNTHPMGPPPHPPHSQGAADQPVSGTEDRQKFLKQDGSHPPTPVAQSPSVSSLHDDFDNVSSPSWPGTPVNKPPTISNMEVLNKLCEFGDEAERRPFLEKLFQYMEDKGAPITVVPAISKTPIDLFRLYHLVKERGGLWEVTKNKKWRDVSGCLNIGTSSSAGFTLRKNYCKYIFPYECKFDRGGIDPLPIIAQLDAMSKKDSKKSRNAGAQNAQDPFRGPPGSGQPFNNFPGSSLPQPPMPNADMQGGPMMPPNVSMMPYEGGMMPNSGMMSGPNSMMPNVPNSGSMMQTPSMGGSGSGIMPNSSLTNMTNRAPGVMTNSGPGAVCSEGVMPDQYGANSMTNQYPRSSSGGGMNSQASGYSHLQQQPPLSSAAGYNQQPTGVLSPSASGSSTLTHTAYTDNTNRVSGSNVEQFGNESYRRGNTMSQDNYMQQDGQQYGPTQFNSRSNQYSSYGQDRYGPQQQRPPSQGMTTPPMRPPSQGSVSSQSGPEISGRYNSQQLTQTEQTSQPQQQTQQQPSPQQPPFGSQGQAQNSFQSNQRQGYTSQQGQTQEAGYSSYPGQQQQQATFPSPKPSQSTSGKLSQDLATKDGYSMPPNGRAGREAQQWGQSRYQPGRPPYTGSTSSGSVSPMPPTSIPYTVYNRQQSPQRPDKSTPFFNQTKDKKPHPMPSNAFPPKKEIVFPADSVEAAQPSLAKKKKVPTATLR